MHYNVTLSPMAIEVSQVRRHLMLYRLYQSSSQRMLLSGNQISVNLSEYRKMTERILTISRKRTLACPIFKRTLQDENCVWGRKLIIGFVLSLTKIQLVK